MTEIQPFRVSSFDAECFEGRKRDLRVTEFSVVPVRAHTVCREPLRAWGHEPIRV